MDRDNDFGDKVDQIIERIPGINRRAMHLLWEPLI